MFRCAGVFMSLLDILFLYLAFRVKQVVCDFFLQPSWMALAKGRPLKQGGVRALSMHAGIHAVFTFIIALLLAPKFWWLGILDFVVHSLVDKGKAMLNNKMGWTYKDNPYWWAFGLDQEAHNMTHLVYIIIIITGSGTSLH
jgi:hypothetical protein